MNEKLIDLLSEYRECTLQIIEIIKNDTLDSLQELINKRQNLLDAALNTSIKKEKMNQIFIELKLDELQVKLNTLIANKISIIKCEMDKIAKAKMANSIYNKDNYNNAKIFSKKI